MSEALEQHQQSREAAEGGQMHAALLIAALAAGLALSEQGAQHAGTAMSSHALAAADLWAQYQAKSIRATEARNTADVVGLLPAAAAQERDTLAARLRADADRFENEPKTGKGAIAADAKGHEAARDAAHEKLEAFDNAAAALQLAIVLTTASIITKARALLLGGFVLGAIGVALAVLALTRPEFAAF